MLQFGPRAGDFIPANHARLNPPEAVRAASSTKPPYAIQDPDRTAFFNLETFPRSKGIISRGEHTPGFCLDRFVLMSHDLKAPGLKAILLDGATMEGNAIVANGSPRCTRELEGGLFIEEFPKLFAQALEKRLQRGAKFEFVDTDGVGSEKFSPELNPTVSDIAATVKLADSPLNTVQMLRGFLAPGFHESQKLIGNKLTKFLNRHYWSLKDSSAQRRASHIFDKERFLLIAPYLEAMLDASQALAMPAKNQFEINGKDFKVGGAIAGFAKLSNQDSLIFAVGDSRALLARDSSAMEQTLIASARDRRNRLGVSGEFTSNGLEIFVNSNVEFSFEVVPEDLARKSHLILHTDWIGAYKFSELFLQFKPQNVEQWCSGALKLMLKREQTEIAHGHPIDDKSFIAIDMKGFY